MLQSLVYWWVSHSPGQEWQWAISTQKDKGAWVVLEIIPSRLSALTRLAEFLPNQRASMAMLNWMDPLERVHVRNVKEFPVSYMEAARLTGDTIYLEFGKEDTE